MVRLLAVLLLFAAFPTGSILVSAQTDDPDAEIDFLLLIDEATIDPSIAGPRSGSLAIESGTTYTEPAGVDVRDFYAYTEFTNPYPSSQHLFDVGFSFRQTAGGEEFRLVIDSLGDWYFKQAGVADTVSGSVLDFNAGGGERNSLELVASGDTGYFAVNGEFAGIIDLSARSLKGDVAVGTGYYAEDQLTGESTPFENFEVWTLDEMLPAGDEAAANLRQIMSEAQRMDSSGEPLAGEIPLALQDLNGVRSEGETQDFYAHAAFTNPYSASEHLWDIGFGFRDSGVDGYRIVIDSDGAWFLSRGTAASLQNGAGAVLNTGADEVNTVDLAAVGGVGYLAVNGEFVATLDLGAIETAGEVWVGSGFYAEDKIDGAITPFADFQVWPLDEAPLEGGDDGASLARDDAVIFDLRPSDGEGTYGAVVVSARGDLSRVEILTFDATGDEQLGIFGGSCAALKDIPAFKLTPLDPDAHVSTSDIPFPFAYLTDGDFAVAIHDSAEAHSLLACGQIPAP